MPKIIAFKNVRTMEQFRTQFGTIVWKFSINFQLTKSDPKRTRGVKCQPSCQLGLKIVEKSYFVNRIAIEIRFPTSPIAPTKENNTPSAQYWTFVQR